jgi:hypothetical protein
MKMLPKNLLISFICLLHAAANSEVVTSIGEYSYGPEISKAQGCRLALDKAKSNALAAVLGEAVSTEQQLFCKETSGKKSDYGCDFNSISWSLIDGDLKNQKIISEQVVEKMGATTCTYKIEVDVVVPSKKPDPNFELKAKRIKPVYQVGEDFTLEFESTREAYFAVFNWLPYQNNLVSRIQLSTSADAAESDVLKKNSVGKYQFKSIFTTEWSKSYSDAKRYYDEWVIVVATKKPIRWLSSYDYDQFREKLREIPADEIRKERLGYQLYK